MIKMVNTKFAWAAVHDYADAVLAYDKAVQNDESAECLRFCREAVDTALDELACQLGAYEESEE